MSKAETAALFLGDRHFKEAKRKRRKHEAI